MAETDELAASQQGVDATTLAARRLADEIRTLVMCGYDGPCMGEEFAPVMEAIIAYDATWDGKPYPPFAALTALREWRQANKACEAKALNLAALTACGESVTQEDRQELRRLVESEKSCMVALGAAADALYPKGEAQDE